ncbi:MAG: alpha-E domain-containing protein [Lysobacteraceae bacterium]
MLARTADGLYWLARSMERADYLARLLQVAGHMSAARVDNRGHSEWASAIIASGSSAAFAERHAEATPGNVIDWLAFNEANPSSIASCILNARRNARAVRTALSTDVWEAVNGAWHGLQSHRADRPDADALPRFLDWVKSRTNLFHGACSGTLLRKDGFHFARIGRFLERADNTARILDVKYHVLLPEPDDVGGLVDYYQWLAVLRVVGARRAYRVLFRGRISADNVAELLVLRNEFPRSLAHCLGEVSASLDAIEVQDPDRSAEPRRLAHVMHAQLRYGRIGDIFEQGLHEYLTDTIARLDRLGTEIARGHLF